MNKAQMKDRIDELEDKLDSLNGSLHLRDGMLRDDYCVQLCDKYHSTHKDGTVVRVNGYTLVDLIRHASEDNTSIRLHFDV